MKFFAWDIKSKMMIQEITLDLTGNLNSIDANESIFVTFEMEHQDRDVYNNAYKVFLS